MTSSSLGSVFQRRDIFGLIFGHNGAFELKIHAIVLIGIRFTFPKHQSKSLLSFVIIEIIALKDNQYWPKTTKTAFKAESKLNVLCT